MKLSQVWFIFVLVINGAVACLPKRNIAKKITKKNPVALKVKRDVGTSRTKIVTLHGTHLWTLDNILSLESSEIREVSSELFEVSVSHGYKGRCIYEGKTVFRYKIVCHPIYRANGTIQKLRFQLAPRTPEPDEGSFCKSYAKPMGTFELIMTNGTKYQTVFNRLYSSTGKKLSSAPLSIKSARFIYFDVTDIVDEISVYLHTRIIWQKYN